LRDPEKAKKLQVGFLAMKKDGSHGAFCIQKALLMPYIRPQKKKYMNQKAGLADGKKHT